MKIKNISKRNKLTLNHLIDLVMTVVLLALMSALWDMNFVVLYIGSIAVVIVGWGVLKVWEAFEKKAPKNA